MTVHEHRRMLYRTLVQLLDALQCGTEAEKAIHIEDGYETLKRIKRDMTSRPKDF